MSEMLDSASRPGYALAECKYCGGKVRAYRLDLHMSKKCPKRPSLTPIDNAKQERSSTSRIAAGLDKKVLVSSRLKRIYRDMNPDLSNVDDLQLAKLFKAFYTMYVWEGDGVDHAASRERRVNDDGELSTSLRAVSGGLPSLGKRAK